MNIYLVRHPHPQVADDICYGDTDLGLDPDVLIKAVHALTPQLPRAARLFSSPMKRCLRLADALAGPLDCAPALIEARLRELSFGSWEMRRWDTISKAEVDAWVADLPNYRPGGGESVHAMAERVAQFYRDQLIGLGQDAILICHAGTIRLLSACQRGMGPLEMATWAASTPMKIGYGEVVRLPV